MMKLLFLTPVELAETLTEVLRRERNNANVICQVGYSEEQGADVAFISYTNNTEDTKPEEVPLTNFLKHLNEFYQVCIQSYDVYEVGDEGEGFAFQIK
ncbi:hypothetical protein NDS46_31540 (plasmid) [Paenibacillus thiaminolyticus]|uniref:hypothetical protein n=1 Tax=Paenibacillus thiaminolyticus TaxID=49283 RepID=UPI002330E7D5|nr:hypothetical protein [Paenibacillus thiaminolyticus]WCF11492.1 hypothetical protein NDS46_31540 [Paenibacillus thiaminolyticus]